MNIKKLLKEVDEAYDGEGIIGEYFADPKGYYGDTLAAFVASTISEYDDSEDVVEDLSYDSVRSIFNDMERSVRQLTAIMERLETVMNDMEDKG